MQPNLLESLQSLIGYTITNVQLVPRKDYDGSNVDDDPQIVLILDNQHKAFFNASFGEYTGNSQDEYPIRNSITLELNSEDLLDSRDVIAKTLLLEGFKEVGSDRPIFVKSLEDSHSQYITTYGFYRPEEKDNLWLFVELDKYLNPLQDGEWVYLNLQTSEELRTFLKIMCITDEGSNE